MALSLSKKGFITAGLPMMEAAPGTSGGWMSYLTSQKPDEVWKETRILCSLFWTIPRFVKEKSWVVLERVFCDRDFPG